MKALVRKLPVAKSNAREERAQATATSSSSVRSGPLAGNPLCPVDKLYGSKQQPRKEVAFQGILNEPFPAEN
ncbi:hypothetical protein HK097_010412 [Rhizophlyctis rosea]|uniref:Uncharacterized protein n=1 Tax=Rhizophlyctis rosea TaxID=64517 RepID=A0AAD5X510_9FUNG|nr:hypothetical protein HK097_010412 [Rhizophlyctis rosea]